MKPVLGARFAGTIILGSALLLAGGCGYKNPPVPPETIVPKAIEDLRYTITDDGVRMTWTYPIETIKGTDITKISSFDLFRAEISLDDYCPTCPVPFTDPIEVQGGETMLDGKRRVATYDYDMPRSGHKYFFKVQARTDWWASSADSNIITFVWHLPPATPAGLKSKAGDATVNLSWSPVSTLKDGSDVVGEIRYQLYRQGETGTFAKLGEPIKATTFQDKGLKNGVKYSYKVQSVMVIGDDIVEGGTGDPVTDIPIDVTPPPVPEGVLAIETSAGIRVIWDSNMDKDIAGYNIYRRTSETGEYEKVGTVKAPATSFVDKKVKDAVRYYYSVTAIDASSPPNESGKSKEATLRH